MALRRALQGPWIGTVPAGYQYVAYAHGGGEKLYYPVRVSAPVRLRALSQNYRANLRAMGCVWVGLPWFDAEYRRETMLSLDLFLGFSPPCQRARALAARRPPQKRARDEILRTQDKILRTRDRMRARAEKERLPIARERIWTLRHHRYT